MAELEIREATTADADFARKVFDTTAASVKGKFSEKWSPEHSAIISIGGEHVGWFSYMSKGADLTIENFHLLPGNRGIPSMILNIIALDAKDRNKKVSIRSPKSDSRTEFFRQEGFPITDESEAQIKFDLSDFWDRSHKAWKNSAGSLPWNRK